jgi:hypothetical protein
MGLGDGWVAVYPTRVWGRLGAIGIKVTHEMSG